MVLPPTNSKRPKARNFRAFCAESSYERIALRKTNYTKTKLNMHLKGFEMETYSSPFLRFCIGIAIILFALGLALGLGGNHIVEIAKMVLK